MERERTSKVIMRIAAVAVILAMTVTSIPLFSAVSAVYAAGEDILILPDGERPGTNIASEVSDLSVSFCSLDEKKGAINDGRYSTTSISPKEEGVDCWGTRDSTRTSNEETITFSWSEKVRIKGTGIYFWCMESGAIQLPKSYKLEYLNEEGNYVEISNANGLGCMADGFNLTAFEPIETLAFRIILEKQENDNNGVGIIECEVYGEKVLMPVQTDKTELQNIIKEYESLKKEDYTVDSWRAYEKVLESAVQINNDSNATQEQINKILTELKTAYSNLIKLLEVPAKGTIHKVGKATYKVTKSSETDGTVTFYRPVKDTYKLITIPDTVEINGFTFKVTKVAIKACYNNKNLIRVVISENVDTIYKNAFSGCSKLKTVTFRGKTMTKVGKNAFKNVNTGAVFNILYGKVKAYKKLLLNSGAKSSLTFNTV